MSSGQSGTIRVLQTSQWSLADAGTPGQWPPFPTVATLEACAAELLNSSHADSTLCSYDRLWTDFTKFAGGMGVSACPATEETIISFLTWLDLMGHSSCAVTALAAIARAHTLQGAVSLTSLP